MPSKRRSRWGLAIAVSLLTIPVMLEVAVRLAFDALPTPGELRSQSLDYESVGIVRYSFPLRSRQLTIERAGRPVAYRINRLGYRGEDFSETKRPGATRIVFVGGSAVFDPEQTEGNDWPHRVGALLGVEAVNAGVPGHSAIDSVGRFLSETHRLRPDIALLYSGWNSLKHFRSPASVLRTLRVPETLPGPRLNYVSPLDQLLSESSQLYLRLRAKYLWRKLGAYAEEGYLRDTERFSSSVEPSQLEQYRREIETFVDIALNIDATPVLVTQARLPVANSDSADRDRIGYHYVGLSHDALVSAFREQDRILAEVSASKGALLIDASRAMSGQSDYFVDQIHLSPAGSQALAELVADALRSQLPL